MKTLAVIGGGLFGNVAARKFSYEGWDVTLYDDSRPLRASQCAGCFFKPSWLTNLRNSEEGIKLLDDLYGVETLQFRTHLNATLSIQRVHPRHVLNTLYVNRIYNEEVETVHWPSRIVTTLSGSVEGPFDAIYAATGMNQKLVPAKARTELKGRMGTTLYFKGQREPRIAIWAPYKQSISAPIKDVSGNVTWFGDGTTIKPENWNPKYNDRALAHAEQVGLPSSDLKFVRFGIRPMGKSSGHFVRIAPKCYFGTAGGKNGVVLAALFANRLWEAITK